MQLQLSPSVIAEAATALGILIAAVYFPWRDLNRRANLIGSVLLTIAALWMLTHSLEIGTPVATYKASLMGLQLIWGLIAMALWLMYIIQYSAYKKWQSNRIYALFGIMPLLAILAVATNHIYGLMWTAPGLDIHNPYLPLEPAYGPVYWVCMVYIGALVACGIFLILKKIVRRRYNFRGWEPWTLILAAIIPLLAAFLEITGVTQPAGLTIGITPFFSGIGVIILVWSLPRFHLQKVIPVARNTVFERIGDGVVVLNMQNRVVDLNPAAERLAGYTSSEALGLPVEQIWPNWPSQLVPSEPDSTVYEEMALARAGEQKTYDLYINTITDHKNSPINKIALLVDTTERKRAEEALRRSEEKLRLMFESVTDGIAVTDLKGNIVEMNQADFLLHGYATKEEMIGLPSAAFIAERDRARIAHYLKEVFEEGSIRDVGYTLVRKDGGEFPAELSAAVLKDISGNPFGIIGIIKDITERKRAEEENLRLREKAEMSNRLAAIGEMAAGIAHEINNPLTGVIGFSELLLTENLAPEIKEQLQIIADGSHRVKDIVKRMLTFARQDKLMKTSANVNELIDNTLELRSYVLRTANIEVIRNYDPSLPWVTVDSGQMQQVFLNLIVNAEYAMKKAHDKGNLTITTAKKDGYIRISFKDDGPGMSPEVIKKLFHPFFTTKGPGEGTGLGLSLSRSIILEHNGTIEIESQPGKGANFIITLPVTPTTEEAISETTADIAAIPEKVRAARILVVDDEAGTLSKLQGMPEKRY
jgi:PAS domain S-box-containing protein